MVRLDGITYMFSTGHSKSIFPIARSRPLISSVLRLRSEAASVRGLNISDIKRLLECPV